MTSFPCSVRPEKFHLYTLGGVLSPTSPGVMLDTFENKDDLWETAENLTFDKGLLKEGGSLTFATAGVYRQDGILTFSKGTT